MGGHRRAPVLVEHPFYARQFPYMFSSLPTTLKLQDEEVEAQSPNNLSQVHSVSEAELRAEPRSPVPELESGSGRSQAGCHGCK